jgi:hypothetical protein
MSWSAEEPSAAQANPTMELRNFYFFDNQVMFTYFSLLFDTFVFSCSFSNDSVSISDYVGSDDWIIVKNELERIWKEEVVV